MSDKVFKGINKGMELLLVIGVLALLYYFFSSRKKETRTHELTTIQKARDNAFSYLHQPKTTITKEKKSSLTNQVHSKMIGLPPTRITSSSIKTQYKKSYKQNDEAPTHQKLSTTRTGYVLTDKTQLSKKLCKKCKIQKSFSEFRLNSNTEDGYTKYCNTCMDSKSDKDVYLRCPKCGKNRRKTSFFKSKKANRKYSKWCKYCHK